MYNFKIQRIWESTWDQCTFLPRWLFRLSVALISSETGSEVGHNLITLLIDGAQDGIDLISHPVYFACREVATSIHKLSHAKLTVQHTFKQHTKKLKMQPCSFSDSAWAEKKKYPLKQAISLTKVMVTQVHWYSTTTEQGFKWNMKKLKPIHLLAHWWEGLYMRDKIVHGVIFDS